MAWLTPTEAVDLYGVDPFRLGTLALSQKARSMRWGRPNQKVHDASLAEALGLASPREILEEHRQAARKAELVVNRVRKPSRHDPISTRRHVVYRFYDAEGGLLYVGVTFAMPTRLDGHRKEKDWWTDVRRIDLEHFDSRAEAEAHEARLIRELQPPRNTAGLPPSVIIERRAEVPHG